MKSTKPVNPFSPIEIRKFVMPVSLAAIFVFAGMAVEVLYLSNQPSSFLFFYGVLGILYIIFCNIILVKLSNIKVSYKVVNAILTGLGLGYLFLVLPDSLTEINHILVIFCVIAIATTSGRRYAYLSVLGILAISLPHNVPTLTSLESFLGQY